MAVPPLRRTARLAPLLGTFVALLALHVVVAGQAVAQDAPQLPDEVTDEVGALDGDEQRVQAALEDVRNDGIHLFALYTDATGGRPITEFADATAAANSLGGDDALLVVAVDDRTYGMWVSDALTSVSDAEIDQILVERVEPLLADGDYPGAAVAAAQGLAEAAAGDVAVAPPSTEESGGGPNLGAVLVLLAGVGLGGMFLVERVRERRGLKRAAEERDRRTGALAREANAMLLAADEAVRAAQHEIGFAEAQFREPDVAAFRAALEQSRDELRDAFAVRQRLDDDVPDAPDEREAMLNEIIAGANRVDEILSAQHARLAELRDLERNAPAILAALPDELDEAEARAERAEPLMKALGEKAATMSLAVRGNLTEAAKRIAAGRQLTEAGQQAVEADRRTDAAHAARDAQEALAQANELVAAVEHLVHAAEEAERYLDDELRAAAADIDAAEEALAAGRVEGLHARLAEARSLLEQARAEAAADDRDVLAAYRLATHANAAADDVLAGLRDAAEQRARDRAAAESALRSAEAVYTQAADYLQTRRRGIGREARTRLQESERHLLLARSLVDSDPRQCTQEAQTAQRLAEEAYRLAQRDFDAHDGYGGPFGRGPFGGGWGGRRGRTIIIGGFPIPIGGSGWGGGGWGGSTWGSPGGGRSMGGGFGGGRSFGGGFGGGRSSGGRF